MVIAEAPPAMLHGLRKHPIACLCLSICRTPIQKPRGIRESLSRLSRYCIIFFIRIPLAQRFDLLKLLPCARKVSFIEFRIQTLIQSIPKVPSKYLVDTFNVSQNPKITLLPSRHGSINFGWTYKYQKCNADSVRYLVKC